MTKNLVEFAAGPSICSRVSKLDDVAHMTALQAELRWSTRHELVSLLQEAIKRRAAGETLASIAKSYAVDISMISRLASGSILTNDQCAPGAGRNRPK